MTLRSEPLLIEIRQTIANTDDRFAETGFSGLYVTVWQ